MIKKKGKARGTRPAGALRRAAAGQRAGPPARSGGGGAHSVWLFAGLALMVVVVTGLAWWWAAGGLAILPGQTSAARSGLQPVPTPGAGLLDDAAQAQVGAQFARVAEVGGAMGASDAVLGSSYGALGQLLLAYDLAGAEAAFKNASQLDRENHRWPYYLGYMKVRQGQADDAVAMFQRVLELAPSDTPARLQLAEVLIDLGRLDEADPLLQEALARNAGYYWVYVLLGRLADGRRDPSAAVRYYERALELNPEARMLKRPLAMSYRNLGDLEQSDALLAEAGTASYQRFDPLLEELQALRKDSQANVRQAGEMVASQPAQALALLEAAEATDPDNPELFVIKAEALLRLDQLAAAAGAAQEATRLAPDGPLGGLAQYTLGTVLARMGAREGAESAMLRAIELSPEDTAAPKALAAAYRRAGRCAEAVPLLRSVVDLEPREKLAHVELAMCLVQSGRSSDARAHLESVTAAFAGDRDLTDALARVLAAAPDDAVRDGAGAVSLAEAAVQQIRAVDTLATLAMALAESGDFDGAVKVQQEAVRMAEQDRRWASWPPMLEEALTSYQRREALRQPWPEVLYRR